MRYTFHPEAEAEFEDAVAYYEKCRPALGYDFATEVWSAIKRIIAHPEAWSLIEDDIRRCLLRRFPYGIIYGEQNDEIYILAVMHLRRDPDYWKHRIR